MISLTLPLPPSANRLYRAFVRGKRATSIKSREYREWIARAQSIVAKEVGNLEPLTGPCTAVITLYLQRRRDVDNSAKPILDVLQGFVYANDSQVRRLLICREQVERGALPYVVVKIEEE